MKRSILLVLLVGAFCSCHTNRHVVQTSDTSRHTENRTDMLVHAVSIDSLLQNLSMSADSVVVSVLPPKGDTLTPIIRVTAHQPRVSKEQRQIVASDYSAMRSDTAACSTNTSTHYDDSKESIVVAEPPSLTWLFIVLAVLLIAAVFLLLWLHKKRII